MNVSNRHDGEIDGAGYSIDLDIDTGEFSAVVYGPRTADSVVSGPVAARLAPAHTTRDVVAAWCERELETARA